MSTRSGKRLHSSVHENFIKTDSVTEKKSERKVRNRRHKENHEDLTGKPKIRDNYVRCPSDDEEEPQRQLEIVKHTRKLRKNTLLKEFNFDSIIKNSKEEILESDVQEVNDIRVPLKTRRSKRFLNGDTESEDQENTETVHDTAPETHKGKKSKKLKNQNNTEFKNVTNFEVVDVQKKKKDKKKKRQSKHSKKASKKKTDTEFIEVMKKDASFSDSFHSAAGSPVGASLKLMTDPTEKLDTTFDKSSPERLYSNNAMDDIRKHYTTIEKSPNKKTAESIDITFERPLSDSLSRSINEILNATYEKSPVGNTQTHYASTSDKTLDSIKKLDFTIEKLAFKKLSPLSSHNTTDSNEAGPVTFNKIEDNLISQGITSDKSRSSSEFILNATPILIESSVDTSEILNQSADKSSSTTSNSVKTPEPEPVAPLIRQGTFTKDGPDPIIMSPKPRPSINCSIQTPKRISIPTPGNTPYHSNGMIKNKSINLNLTHSIEKCSPRKASLEMIQRSTKVMFCSPVDNTAMKKDRISKVIKSSMKGSNKSFVFEDYCPPGRPAGRKRSFTHNDAEDARAKRSRLTGELQESVNRLSRPRTVSVTPKSSEPTTPLKKTTPTQLPRSETKLTRVKLPNFAALHQKQFQKMESLDECQERKAKRAKQLLSPTGSLAVLDRKNCKATMETSKLASETKKPQTPNKSRPTSEAKPGYTRFGFKMNCDVNPFSVPPTTGTQQNKTICDNQEKPNGVLKRQPSQPSLQGATSYRRVIAKQAMLREKSSTSLKGKRDVTRTENRTIIKGVRTNRRFELQMMSRNMN